MNNYNYNKNNSIIWNIYFLNYDVCNNKEIDSIFKLYLLQEKENYRFYKNFIFIVKVYY